MQGPQQFKYLRCFYASLEVLLGVFLTTVVASYQLIYQTCQVLKYLSICLLLSIQALKPIPTNCLKCSVGQFWVVPGPHARSTGIICDFWGVFGDILSISMFIGQLGGTSSISELEKVLRNPTRHQVASWVKND